VNAGDGAQVAGIKTRQVLVFALVRAVAIVFVLATLAPRAHANPYDDGMKRVRLLSESPSVRLLPFGQSGAGRRIPAYVISDFSVPPSDKARVLIIAGQHGDEYNPVAAVLTLSRQLSAGFRDDITRRCLIVVVPMANPDGIAAHTRLTSTGADMNRDWAGLRTCEAQYVHSIIKTWRPNAIIDAHEWTGPSPVPENSVEIPRCRLATRRHAIADLATRMAHAAGLMLVKDSGASDARLLHRRYDAIGYASYLIETAQGESYAAKSRAYVGAIEQVANAVAADVRLRSTLSPASTSFSPAGLSAYLDPAAPTADPEASALGMLASAVALYCLMMWIVKPLAAKRDSAWSRKFRKCSMDCDLQTHPLLRRRGLEPLTSRSSAHRRIRARYASELIRAR